MKKNSVGRPKKTDRDAAVYLARWWRMNCCGETASQADEWIVRHWKEKTPAGAKVGITDERHVRMACQRLEGTWLKEPSTSKLVSDGIRLDLRKVTVLDSQRANFHERRNVCEADFELDGCVVVAIEDDPHGASKCLFWAPGLLVAQTGKTVPDWGSSARTEIAVAIARQWR